MADTTDTDSIGASPVNTQVIDAPATVSAGR